MNTVFQMFHYNFPTFRMEDYLEDNSVNFAAKYNSLTQLKFLIENGEAVDVADDRGWRPIHEAAIFPGGTECLEELVRHVSTNINWRTDEGETALLLACKRRSLSEEDLDKAIDILLGYGANPNIADNEMETPLLVAVQKKNLPVIKRLLCAKADPNCPDCSGWYPLHQAAMSGQLEVINLLLEAGAQVNVRDECGLTPIFNASQHGYTDCLEVLLKAAKEKGQSNIVNIGDKDLDGATPLMIATQQGHTACVSMLLDYGANPYLRTTHNTTALHKALLQDQAECLTLVMERMNLEPFIKACHPTAAAGQAGTHAEFISPIHLAIEWKSHSCLKLLLSSGFSPDSIYRRVASQTVDIYLPADIEQNQTAFSYAIKKGDKASLLILRQAGASCELTIPPNSSPMVCALMKRTPKMLKWLLDQGAGVNPKSPTSLNMVLLTAMRKQKYLKEVLLHGCDPQPCFRNPYFFELVTKGISPRFVSMQVQPLELILRFLVIDSHVQKVYLHVLQTSEEWNHKELSRRGIQPLIGSIKEQLFKPSQLKHMCRMSIRRHLYSIHGVRLVNTIECLPLPHIIKDYVSFANLQSC